MKERIFDVAFTANSIANPEGILIEANAAFLKLWGYVRQEEVIGKPIAHFLNDPHEADGIVTTLNGMGYWQGDYIAKRRDGSTFVAHGLATVVRDEKGGMLGYQSAVMDVTENKQAEAALRASKEKLRETIELPVDGIILGAPDGVITEANVQMQKLTGRPLEQLLGRHVSEIFAPEELLAKPLRFDLLDCGSVLVNERNLLRADGTTLPVEMHSKKMPDGTYQSIYRDISKRKQAETALRMLSERYRITLATAMDGFCMVDLQGQIVDVNETYCRMSGYDAQELLTMGIVALEAKQSAVEIADQIEKVVALGEARFETLHRRKDGSIFDVEVSVQYQATGGRRLVVFVRDITVHKQTERELRKNQELLNATQHLSKVGGWLWDIEQQSMFWTEETYHIHDYAIGSVGTGLQEHITKSLGCCDAADRPRILAAFERCIQHGEPYDFEYPFTSASGRRLWVRTTARALRGEAGIVKVVGNIIDVTERKHMEDALRQSQELLSLFMRNSPIHSFIKTVTPTESRVLYASENYQQMTGIAGSEMAGMTMADLFPAEFAAKILADDHAVVTSGKILSVEEDFEGRNYSTLKFPIVQGNTTLLAGYTIDVTERKQSEQALLDLNATLEQRVAERTLELNQSENRFRALAEASFEGVAISEDGILLDGNSHFARIHGYALAEMIGRPVTDFIAPESQAEVSSSIASGREGSYEYMGMRKDGTLFPAEVHGRMEDWMGRTLRLSTIRDLTESKQTTSRLQALRTEFEHVQRLALVSEVNAGIIHQISQPLSAMAANISSVTTRLEACKKQRCESKGCDPLGIIRDIDADIARMRGIVTQLRTLVDPERPSHKEIDFNRTLAGMRDKLRG